MNRIFPPLSMRTVIASMHRKEGIEIYELLTAKSSFVFLLS